MSPTVDHPSQTAACARPGTSWATHYDAIKTTAKQAIGLITSDMKIGSGHAAGEPAMLIRELCEQKGRLRNVQIYHLNAMAPQCFGYCEPGFEDHIRHTSFFAGKHSRKAIQEGRSDFVPVFFSDVPRMFRDGYAPIDACFVQLSPPDEEGYCSYGVSCDYAPAMIDRAKLVIAEVNAQMPYTYGERVHVSRLSAVVETDRPVLEVPQGDPDADTSVAEAIAGHISKLIPDGANLQLGIGAVPDAVLKFLHTKKDLGIHTEMFSDGLIDLVEKGVVNGKNNNLHPGKIVACFVMGTQRVYRFIDRNPMVLMKPVDYTNNIMVAGRLNQLVSVNSAIQINFFGEVCADTIGPKQFSGIGGQVDFVRAASIAPGGLSVIAMPSTAKGGAISRIVPMLTPGACVTTSRCDVHYVATEYGCVCLRGKSVRERTLALISIAHPNFRQELTEQAKSARFLT